MAIKDLKDDYRWFLNKATQLEAREKLLQSPYLRVEKELNHCIRCLISDIMEDINNITAKTYKKISEKWKKEDDLYFELRHQAGVMGCDFQRAFYNECLTYTGRLRTNF